MNVKIDNITSIDASGQISGWSETRAVKAHIDGVEHHIVLAIDWEALATQLVKSCMRNKTHKTAITNGNIRGWVKR